jgi:hypothetical protein
MADTPISGLPAAIALTGAEIVPLVQGGQTRRSTAGAIGALSSQSYTHTQASPATVWTVAHNLGFKPHVTARTTGGVEILGNVLHLSDNTLTITFASAIDGFARVK